MYNLIGKVLLIIVVISFVLSGVALWSVEGALLVVFFWQAFMQMYLTFLFASKADFSQIFRYRVLTNGCLP